MSENRTHKISKKIIDYFGKDAFHGKKILDCGSLNGDIAAAFCRLGATVLAIDARQSNLDAISKKHPYVKTQLIDLDSDNWPLEGQQFDFVFSLSVLSYLKDPHRHLSRIVGLAENIVIETEVFDSNDTGIRVPIFYEKSVPHLSFHGEGALLSTANIQNHLSGLCATYKMIVDINLNHDEFVYTWKDQNLGRRWGHHRLWMVRRDAFFAKKTPSLPALAPQYTTAPLIDTPPLPPHIATQLAQSHRVQRRNGTSQANMVNSTAYPKIQPSNNKNRIRLFYNYYIDNNPQRKAEIDFCLQKNLDNRLFETVILYSDQAPTFNFFFDKINKLASNDDISIICNSDIFFDNTINLISKIPTKTNKINKLASNDDISIICNSDIFFDNTINLISKIPTKTIYALSRWEWNNNGRGEALQEARSSQDTWIVRGKIENVNGDFQIGKQCSDNKIAFEFKKAGYNITNPSRTIKSYHYHTSCIKNFKEDDKVEGEFLLLDPVAL